MLRRIDRWIGRHMTAKRWVVVWAYLFGSGVGLLMGRGFGLASGWWSIAVGVPAVVGGALLLWGNLRRLR